MHTTDEKLDAFRRFLDVLDTLREKCPWDAKQTNESLRPNTVEEVYELADALMSDNVDDIKRNLATCFSTWPSIPRLPPKKGDSILPMFANPSRKSLYSVIPIFMATKSRHGGSSGSKLGTDKA